MSTHFDQLTTETTLGTLFVLDSDAPLFRFPHAAPGVVPEREDVRALETPEENDEQDGDEWDEISPGMETDWEWIDDADLFDDLFDDTEPLEDVDWLSRDGYEDDEDR